MGLMWSQSEDLISLVDFLIGILSVYNQGSLFHFLNENSDCPLTSIPEA